MQELNSLDNMFRDSFISAIDRLIDNKVTSISEIASLIGKGERLVYYYQDRGDKRFYTLEEAAQLAKHFSAKGYNHLSELFLSNRNIIIPYVPGMASGSMQDKTERLHRIAVRLQESYEGNAVEPLKDELDKLMKLSADVRAEIGELTLRMEDEDD